MQTLDVRYLPCPRPVAEVKRTLKAMQAGSVLEVLCKDEMSLLDLKGFCSVAGHTLGEVVRHNDYIRLKITK